ncbi:MAG TPA: hypothetical protein VFM08_13370 [Nocardioides sp.]|nr:hypothetical protein [Nocardioides sp.]
MPCSDPGPRPLGLPAQLAWPVRIDPEGKAGPTAKQARGPSWRRTAHGLYVPADVEQTTEQRIVEAAAVLPAYGGVTGWAGLSWLGARWFDGSRRGAPLPVTVATADRSIRPQPGFGIVTSEERMSPRELTVHRGLRVTTAIRSLFFEMRYAASDTEAVQYADMAAYDDLVSRAELGAFVAVNSGWTGVGRTRVGASDMSENAWSPAEVTMRRTWEHDAGLPRPLCNRPVFDLNGRHLGTPDLIDPVAGVLGEYNSALHLEGAQRSIDVDREARFRAAGLECVEMLTGDLTDPFPFIRRLRGAYARAARIPVADRRWTIEPPAWWVPTFTVEQRRNLTPAERERLLGYRRQAG